MQDQLVRDEELLGGISDLSDRLQKLQHSEQRYESKVDSIAPVVLELDKLQHQPKHGDTCDDQLFTPRSPSLTGRVQMLQHSGQNYESKSASIDPAVIQRDRVLQMKKEAACQDQLVTPRSPPLTGRSTSSFLSESALVSAKPGGTLGAMRVDLVCSPRARAVLRRNEPEEAGQVTDLGWS